MSQSLSINTAGDAGPGGEGDGTTMGNEPAGSDADASDVRLQDSGSVDDSRNLTRHAMLAELKALTSELKALKSENKALTSELKALKSENKAVKSENKAVKSENKALKSELKALLSELKALKSENKELRARRTGEFFHSLERFCEYGTVDLDANSTRLRNLGRTKEQAESIDGYRVIRTSVSEQAGCKPAYNAGRTKALPYQPGVVRGLVRGMKNLFTPRGSNARRFFEDEDGSQSSSFEKEKFDVLGAAGGDVAHLIPHAPACALFYGKVALFALGFEEGELSEALMQCLVHGVTVKAKRGRKADHTGLKHNKHSKFQLSRQEEIFDSSPWFLIVPALTVEDVKGWTPGSHYDAVVLVSVQGAEWKTVLVNAEPCTDDTEPRLAIDLLNKFSVALANELLQTNFKSLAPGLPRTLAREKKKRIVTQMKPTRTLLQESKKVTTLKLKDEQKETFTCNVAKVNINCDPFLLAARAAVNLSKHEQCHTLLPPCATVTNDCDSDCSGCDLCGLWDEEKRQPFIPDFTEVCLVETASIESDLDDDF